MRNAKSSSTKGNAARRRNGSGSAQISGVASWGTNSCATGKRAWQTRRDAKAAASLAGRNGLPGMNAFRCVEEDGCGLFHIGHLPAAVRSGEIGRSEYYGSAA